MIQQVYKLTQSDNKVIEAVIRDENLHYMHMSLPKGEALPVHTTNANVYMTVATGELYLVLAGGEPSIYSQGTIIKIPKDTVMDARNNGDSTLKLLVVKTPPPKI